MVLALTMTSQIKITIASETFLLREGLKRILENKKQFKIVSEIEAEKDVWIKLENSKPDVLLIYIDDKFIKSEEISKIAETYPLLQIIVILNNYTKEDIMYLIDNEIKCYLTIECDENEILNAIKMAADNKKFFCEKVLDTLVERKRENENCEGVTLSNREIEIVKLIANGMANIEIAKKLFISIHTVYTHRKNIMKKLGLKSPVEIAFYAINTGLIE